MVWTTDTTQQPLGNIFLTEMLQAMAAILSHSWGTGVWESKALARGHSSTRHHDRVQALYIASWLSLEAGDCREREQTEGGRLRKVDWFLWGGTLLTVTSGSQWGENPGEKAGPDCYHCKGAWARSRLSLDSSYHTQHELNAYIPFQSGARWHNQAQTAVHTKEDSKKLKGHLHLYSDENSRLD